MKLFIKGSYKICTIHCFFLIILRQLTTESNFLNYWQALYDGGCRKMAIAGLPPLGCGFINFRNISRPTACLDKQNSDSQVYNRKLVAMLAELQATLPGSRLVYADLFTPLTDMALNPLKYGELNLIH